MVLHYNFSPVYKLNKFDIIFIKIESYHNCSSLITDSSTEELLFS